MKPKLPGVTQVEKYLRFIDSSRIYSNFGPLVTELEARHASRFGIHPERVISFANATLAIQACIEIGSIEKWVMPNFTFAATAHAAYRTNRTIELVDVDAINWKIDLDLLRNNGDLTSVGVLAVLPFGSPLALNEFRGAQELVIDAAASLGAPIDNLERLREKQFVVFSLHATKVIGAGEGALVIAGSRNDAEMLRAWSNFGFRGSRISSILATNAKMSEVCAAYGLASLDSVKREEQEWTYLLNLKYEILRKIGYFNVSDQFAGFRPYWIVDSRGLNLEKFILDIQLNGIEFRRWWESPISQMPAFSKFVSRDDLSLKNSISLSKKLIGLPFWRDLSPKVLTLLCNIIDENRI